MKDADTQAVAKAVAGFEGWLETIRTDRGYGGPVVGLRGASMGYCGPACDWRYEGLLDGYRGMFQATRDTDYLDRMARDLDQIAAAQLGDGTFRNSYFDANPFEGGVPHEPAVLAASCRASRHLVHEGRPAPPAVASMVERYVEQHLIKHLWNKLLQTFNDWPTSEFPWYAPGTVAAAVELLIEYADLADAWPRVEHYAMGAGASLLAAQVKTGPLAGGLPFSSNTQDNVSPFFAARCLPALAALARKTGEKSYHEAVQALTAFLRAHRTPEGLHPRMVFAHRSAATAPMLLGAVAGILGALDRAGMLQQDDLAQPLAFVLSHQAASGAFDTAVGFGRLRTSRTRPDWRDVIPVCGWQDKVYALLATLHPGQRVSVSTEPVSRDVSVLGRRAAYREDNAMMRIEDAKGRALYAWDKKTNWPKVCEL
jgi:hypothetical protein